MAETQGQHRQKLEEKALDANIASERRGARYGLIIALVSIVGGFYLIGSGVSTEGGIAAIITPIASLAAVFVYGRNAQRRERDRKLHHL